MRIFTEEHRKKLSQARKRFYSSGGYTWNQGKHYITKPRIKKRCLKCNKEFEIIPADRNKRYCSSKCFQDSRLTAEEKKEKKRLVDLKWCRTDKHKRACIEWNKKHPERIKIAQRTAWAYRTGKIKIQPCEVCGDKKDLQKHHPDYTKPLEIKWLCRKCHTELHKQIKETTKNLLDNKENLW